MQVLKRSRFQQAGKLHLRHRVYRSSPFFFYSLTLKRGLSEQRFVNVDHMDTAPQPTAGKKKDVLKISYLPLGLKGTCYERNYFFEC